MQVIDSGSGIGTALASILIPEGAYRWGRGA